MLLLPASETVQPTSSLYRNIMECEDTDHKALETTAPYLSHQAMASLSGDINQQHPIAFWVTKLFYQCAEQNCLSRNGIRCIHDEYNGV